MLHWFNEYKLQAKPQPLRSARVYFLQRCAMCSLTYCELHPALLLLKFRRSYHNLHDWKVEYQTTNCTTLKWLDAVDDVCKVSMAREGAMKFLLTLVIIPKDPFNQLLVMRRLFCSRLMSLFKYIFWRPVKTMEYSIRTTCYAM